MAISNPIIADSERPRNSIRITAVPIVQQIPPSSYYVYSTEKRTNLFKDSEAITSLIGNWRYPPSAGLTLTQDARISPTGTLTADRITATSNDRYVRAYLPIVSPIVHTFSLYLSRPSGSGSVNLSLYRYDPFNSNAYIATGSATVTTSWQRFSITGLFQSAEEHFFVLGGENTWPNGVSLDIWGVQLEEGDTMSPYLATTASSTTTVTYETRTEVVQNPEYEGQTVAYVSSNSEGVRTSSFYVAVDIEGTLTWKRCIFASQYIDSRTGATPDPNLLLYSSISQ